MKIGVYFCNCGENIVGKIQAEAVKKSVLSLSGAVYFKTFGFICSEEGKNFLEKDIKEEKPDRVVIAACSPRDHENTFMRILSSAGMNPYLMQMVNIREQVAWVTPDKDAATQKAIRYIKGAIQRVILHEPLEKKELEVSPDVLIMGAGPAGLKAALSLAQADRKVVLVEKSPLIGGMPVKYEEIFPNLECGPCMLEPMMGEILHSELADKIEILTLSEIMEVVGSYGNFTVKIKQVPRYVSEKLCVGCGECIAACPASSANKFNCGLNTKKAIDVPFFGALPNVPFIDPLNCIRFNGQNCSACKDACLVGPDVIDFDSAENIVTRNVGAIVVATGAALYDCGKLPNLGYGQFPDVFTSFEFERLLASNGPTNGKIEISKNVVPESIAVIHCVGSLDKNHKEYCSGICCEYAFKFNRMIRSKIPEAKVYHFYKELVINGKDDFSLYKSVANNKNTQFIRYSDMGDLNVIQRKKQKTIQFMSSSRKKGTVHVDSVVLCPAVVPAEDTKILANILGITRDVSGFFDELHGTLDSVQSKVKGIYLAGSCHAPMNIRETINQGIAAGGYILSALVKGRKLEIEPITAVVDTERCSGCEICVSVCPFKAVTIEEESGSAVVNAALCHGCGTCVAACPVGGIKGNHFTTEEVLAEVEGLLK
jgi:heterodisulfide reductase subunit A